MVFFLMIKYWICTDNTIYCKRNVIENYPQLLFKNTQVHSMCGYSKCSDHFKSGQKILTFIYVLDLRLLLYSIHLYF